MKENRLLVRSPTNCPFVGYSYRRCQLVKQFPWCAAGEDSPRKGRRGSDPTDHSRTKPLDLPIAGRCLLPDISRNGHLERTDILARMKRAFNTFLLWLLIAALPLQGFAAALQASCGSSAHHTPADMVAPAQDHAQHDDAAMAGHGSAADDTTAKHKHSSCSACATCCIGAIAPPSVTIASMSDGNVQPTLSSPSPLVTGFIPPGLERPPKRVTA